MISDDYKYRNRRRYNEYRNENPERDRSDDLNFRGEKPSYGYPERDRNYDREYDRSSGYFHDQDYGRPAHEYRDYYNENTYPEEPFYGGHFNRERNIGKGYHPQDYDYNRGNADYEREDRNRRNEKREWEDRNRGHEDREGYRKSHGAYDRNGSHERGSTGQYGVRDYEPFDRPKGNHSMSGGNYGSSKNYRGDMNYTGERNYGGNRFPYGSGPQNEVSDPRGSYYENRPDYIDEGARSRSNREREERDRGAYGRENRRDY